MAALTCSIHQRMQRRYRRFAAVTIGIAAATAAGFVTTAAFAFTRHPVLAFCVGLVTLVGLRAATIVAGRADRLRRPLRAGLSTCGSCRLVREGKRRPDGTPIAPKADTP